MVAVTMVAIVVFPVNDDDLTAGQELDAEESPTDLQRPVTHPCAPELLNLHGKRYRHRMATCHAAAVKPPGTSFCGAVTSEQAVMTTEARMAVAMRSLRRVI